MADDNRKKRKLELPEGPLDQSCVAALSAIFTYASESVARAHEDPVTAVHEYRKSLRRARSLLRMLRPLMSGRVRRRIDVPLKESHRSLSSARDQAVLRDTWEQLSGATGIEIPEIGRGLASEPATFSLGARTRRSFDDLVALLAERLQPDLTMADLGRGLRRTYRAARQELRRAQSVADPAHVHALRRRCKDLNYQLEALGSRVSKKRIQGVRKQFARLASDLGEITDLYQLRSAVASLSTPVDAGDLGLAGAAVNEAIELRLANALADADEALAEKPKAWVRSLKLEDD